MSIGQNWGRSRISNVRAISAALVENKNAPQSTDKWTIGEDTAGRRISILVTAEEAERRKKLQVNAGEMDKNCSKLVNELKEQGLTRSSLKDHDAQMRAGIASLAREFKACQQYLESNGVSELVDLRAIFTPGEFAEYEDILREDLENNGEVVLKTPSFEEVQPPQFEFRRSQYGMSLESDPGKNRLGIHLANSPNQEEDMDIDSDQNVFSDEEERKLDKRSRWIKRLNCFVFPDQIIAGKVSITSYGSWDDINNFDSTKIASSLKKFSRPPKPAICSQLKVENCSKMKYEMIQHKTNLDQFHAACKPGSLFPDSVIGDVSKAPKTDCVQVARLETPQTTVLPLYLQRVRGNQKHYYNAYYEANHYNLQIQQAQVIANPDPSGHDFIYLSE